jgi:acyl carrier protein
MPSVEEVTHTVLNVWKRVLRADVPEGANFFDAGGASLAAVHVAMLLQEEYGIRVDAADVLAESELSAFVRLLHGRIASGGPGPYVFAQGRDQADSKFSLGPRLDWFWQHRKFHLERCEGDGPGDNVPLAF